MLCDLCLRLIRKPNEYFSNALFSFSASELPWLLCSAQYSLIQWQNQCCNWFIIHTQMENVHYHSFEAHPNHAIVNGLALICLFFSKIGYTLLDSDCSVFPFALPNFVGSFWTSINATVYIVTSSNERFACAEHFCFCINLISFQFERVSQSPPK